MNLKRTVIGCTVILLMLCLFATNVRAQQASTENQQALLKSYSSSIPLSVVKSDATKPGDVPELSFQTMAGQFLFGQLFGGVGGILGGFASVEIFQCKGNWCELGEFAGGALVGYALGSSLGVYMVGNSSQRTASYPLILLGDVVGMGIGLKLLIEFSEHSNPIVKNASIISAILLPVVAAITSYHLTKKSPNPAGQKALLNIGEDVTISSPALSAVNSSPLLKKQFIPGVEILNFRF